jgi:putative toxin-antitoxin system antitoxin component (TIGR02293 family)
MQYLYIVIAIKMEKQIKRPNTGRRAKIRKTPTKTNWRIVGSKGEVVTSIEVNIPKTHFLQAKDKVGLDNSRETEAVLAFGQIKPMIKYLGYSQQEVANVLEVDPSTLSRWKKEDKPIGKLRSKTMYDIDHIITKGIRIFGSEENFKEWLHTTNYALGDKKPIELLKDPYGIELVDNAIEAMSWGNVM